MFLEHAWCTFNSWNYEAISEEVDTTGWILSCPVSKEHTQSKKQPQLHKESYCWANSHTQNPPTWSQGRCQGLAAGGRTAWDAFQTPWDRSAAAGQPLWIHFPCLYTAAPYTTHRASHLPPASWAAACSVMQVWEATQLTQVKCSIHAGFPLGSATPLHSECLWKWEVHARPRFSKKKVFLPNPVFNEKK